MAPLSGRIKNLYMYRKYFDLHQQIKEIKSYLPSFNEEKFRQAFEFAEEAHRGQLRKDGETPYIVHPLNVVAILAGLHADEDVLIAALLHDVPEDTKYDIEDVKQLFGDEIAFLVDGITKLSKVHYQHNMPERDIESLKKLFLHSSKDPRIILIKLADRLHNMRTLKNIASDEKRLRIAGETLEIFVPIANLLGIQELKSELEDLCFQYLFAQEYETLKKKVETDKEKHRKLFSEFSRGLQRALKTANIDAQFEERKQNLYTIYKKISSKGRIIDDVEDRIAIRVVVNTVPECYQVLGIVHNKYIPKIDKFKDYIANPKTNGYQSLHTTVFGPEGVLTEIQIRTKEMDLEAEYGIAAHFFLDESEKIGSDRRSSWVNKIVEWEEQGEGFLEDLKLDIFHERIVVFTPKGENVDLPSGATVIDFAYAIHTDVGNKAFKAELNNVLVPISTTLKTGDVVTVLTSEDVHPDLSWLSFAKTSNAKNKIRAYFKRVSQAEKIKEGRKILQKEFDIAGLGMIENLNFKKLKAQIMLRYGKNYKTFLDLLTAIGEGGVRGLDIVKIIKKPQKKGIKIRVKVLAKNRFGLLKDISKVFYEHASDMTYVKAWASHLNEDAFFELKVVVNDLESIGKIFDELAQIDDVRYVYRVSNRGIFLTYFLSGLTGLLWIFHPFVIQYIAVREAIPADSFWYNIAINIGLLVLLSMVLFVTRIMKKYFPLTRNKKTLWLIAFTVPAIALITLFAELFYFNLKMSWLAVLIEVSIVYLFLGISFVNFRRDLKGG